MWLNERNVPQELLELHKLKGLPIELKDLVEKAVAEVFDYGAVTYTTKANLEYMIHKHYDALQKLAEQHNEEYENAEDVLNDDEVND